MRLKHQRFSFEDKTLIRKLTEQGQSLAQISKLFNVGKPTIYYQVRKFKPRIKKDFVVNLNDFQIGELIGAFAGDGSFFHEKGVSVRRESHYRIRYYLTFEKEKEYAEYLLNLLKCLNLNARIMNRDNSVWIIDLSSKKYFEFIKRFLTWKENKTLTIQLKDKIYNYSEDFMKGFARGLMDTDGYVETSNVSCACISKGLIDNLAQIFDYFKINYKRSVKIRPGINLIYLIRVYSDSLEKYREMIGFSNSHKIVSLNKILSNKHHRKG